MIFGVEEEFGVGEPMKPTLDHDNTASTKLLPDDDACHHLNPTLVPAAKLKVPIHDVGDGATAAAVEVV